MDAAAWERVYGAFLDFHAYFLLAFGRKQPREIRRHYLWALMVQSHEWRSARNGPRRLHLRRGRCSVFSPNRPGTMRG